MSRHGWGENGDLQNQSSAFGLLSAVPAGSYPPTCWVMPTRAGALASRGNVTGSGEITPFALIQGRNLASALTGAGEVTGSAQLIISMVAALTGSGEVTASVQGFLNLAASLAGSGDIAGSIQALAHAEAAVTGDAQLAATISALGTLAAAINVTGSTLSTANVGAAVWAQIIEAGYTAEEILRLVAAANAGKTTGAGTNNMKFRDLADTKDRLDGTLDSNGNRTAVTIDPS